MEKRFFVWVNNILKVLVYATNGDQAFVRIEDPKPKALA